MKLITEPRLGQTYIIIPTNPMVRHSTSNRFIPLEGVTAIYDEYLHSRFQEGAIQLFEEKDKEMESTTKIKGSK